MLEKMKAKMVFMSVLIAVTAGIATGAAFWACDNSKCICRKAKKAYKAIEDKLDT